jgi:hypothetical protein
MLEKFKKYAILINLILVISLFAVYTPATNYIVAEDEEEEEPVEEDYQINVRAEFSSSRIAGIIFDIVGGGVSETKTSSTSADSIFDGLATGEYLVSITIPASSEYELASGTDSRSISLSDTNQEETLIFLLQKKAPDVDDNLARIRAFSFPAELTKVGSTTTNFSNLSPEQLSNVENFTLDNPGINKIVYLQGLNLETFSEYQNIENIAEYIDLETVGKVSFNTDSLDKFDAPAKITMYKIRLVDFLDEEGEASEDLAIIEKDGQTSDEVTNLAYSNNQLSFNVAGFSTYSISPRIRVEIEDLEPIETEEDVLNAKYETKDEKVTLVVYVDNLDAEISVTNGGEIVKFENELDEEGMVTGEINLEEGVNKLKIKAELDNGQSQEKIINVELLDENGKSNNASTLFTIAIIIVVILGAGAAGGYYYYRSRKIKKNKTNKKKADKDKYEPGLLIDEEKKIYNKPAKPEQTKDQKLENTEPV